MSASTRMRDEDLIEVTTIFTTYRLKGVCECIETFSDLRELIIETVDEFEEKFKDADWNELDYYDEIDAFTRKCLAKALWELFEDVPVNPETELTETAWNIFPRGIFKEDIWHWFEKEFLVSVAEDLMYND